MKAKHLNIEKDKALYLEIRKEIKDKLIMKKKDADHYFIFKSLVYGVLTIGTYYLLYILENPVLFIIDFVAFGFILLIGSFFAFCPKLENETNIIKSKFKIFILLIFKCPN